MVNYISRINNISIGGGQFSGNGSTYKGQGIGPFTLAVNATRNWGISGIIPNDGYDYEAIIYGIAIAPKNAWCGLTVQQQNSSPTVRLCHTTSINKATTVCGSGAVLPIFASKPKTLVIQYTGTANTTSGNIYVDIVAYRKMGTAGVGTNNKIRGIDFKGTNLQIGGGFTDGIFHDYTYTVANNATINHRGSSSTPVKATYSIASILPNDGYSYEVYGRAWAQTSGTSGDSMELEVGTESGQNYGYHIGRIKTRHSSGVRCGNSFKVYVGTNRQLTMINWGTQGTATYSIVIEGWKRCAKQPSGNLISKINDMQIGGYQFAGAWTSKYYQVTNNLSFNDSATTDRNYTISNYLPNDGYVYEILYECLARTANTSGASNNLVGWFTGGYNTVQLAYLITREATNQAAVTNGVAIAKADSSGHITFTMRSYSAKANNVTLTLLGYRRIGVAGQNIGV